jgi:hypothetical protein
MMEKIKKCYVDFATVVIFTLLIQGCSSAIDTTKFLTVRALGVLVAPEGATGNYDPVWQEYTLEGVFLSPDPDSGDALSLYSEDPEAFKVIDRPQIIYKREIDNAWVGETFDTLVVRFSTTVTAAGKYADDYKIELAESDVSNVDSFTIEKGQGIEATINIQWKNTVTRDEASDTSTEEWMAPTFDVSISLD